MNIYGIKNCDKVKSNLKTLDNKKVKYEFYDLKKIDLDDKIILKWKKELGRWPVNLNSRIFKTIQDEFDKSTDKKKIELIKANTSSLIRPIFEIKTKTYFDIKDLKLS